MLAQTCGVPSPGGEGEGGPTSQLHIPLQLSWLRKNSKVSKACMRQSAWKMLGNLLPYKTFGDCSENEMDRALMGKKVRFRQMRHGVIGLSEERMESELPGEPSETNSCLVPR